MSHTYYFLFVFTVPSNLQIKRQVLFYFSLSKVWQRARENPQDDDVPRSVNRKRNQKNAPASVASPILVCPSTYFDKREMNIDYSRFRRNHSLQSVGRWRVVSCRCCRWRLLWETDMRWCMKEIILFLVTAAKSCVNKRLRMPR